MGFYYYCTLCGHAVISVVEDPEEALKHYKNCHSNMSFAEFRKHFLKTEIDDFILHALKISKEFRGKIVLNFRWF